ncbi:MAG: short-chain dehydrogenase/reductase [Proteobacteria bacterium]|nr:short-chain dehydrogenase/reductase [Pseudomonadota bacterium]
MDLHLSGKTALITGGSKGIGLAVAESLAAEGCHLHLSARTESELQSAATSLRDRYNVNVQTHALDLGTSEGVDALGAACADVDILINNAGAIPGGTLTDLDEKRWREAWELKLFGYINLSRHLYSAMQGRKSGVIINVIGGAATNPQPGYIAGAAANAALAAFSVALGKESPAHGIRVIGMHPGATRTERAETLLQDRAETNFGDRSRWRELQRPLPFDRMTEPSEVGDFVTFLASDRCAYTSGVVLSITGGL